MVKHHIVVLLVFAHMACLFGLTIKENPSGSQITTDGNAEKEGEGTGSDKF